MTITAPAAQGVSQPSTDPSVTSRSNEQAWRRWRTPLIIAVVVLLGGIFIALLSPSQSEQANSYLDPLDTGATGTHALADILADRGTTVDAVTTVEAASSAVARGASSIVITSPELLTPAQLRLLAQTRADLVIVEPDAVTLRALAPGIARVGVEPIRPVQPDCSLPAAVLAGSADMGGVALRQRSGPAPVGCYISGNSGFLMQYSAVPRKVTVLGTGAPLENQNLAMLGNAALSLNLLQTGRQIAWLTPQFAPAAATGGPKSIWSLIPLGTYLVALQLGIALVLTALWRGRRLGPLSIEQLPVVVRASETTEGHARLYQARRARDRAAAALREATLRRLSPALGLPTGASAEATAAALAARSALSSARLHDLLVGSAPGSDAALVELAEDLDALEREVRAE